MNLRLLLGLFLTVVFLITGCKKDETEDPGASSLASGKSQISFTISGGATSSFSSNTQLSTVLKYTEVMNISGSAISGMGAEIGMMILPANTTTGTYTSASNNPGDFAFSYSNGSVGWGRGC